MLRRLCQTVLVLMVLLTVVAPFTEQSGFDQFPVAGNDFELELICCLCFIGMFLILSLWLRLLVSPALKVFEGPRETARMVPHTALCSDLPSPLLLPLRI